MAIVAEWSIKLIQDKGTRYQGEHAGSSNADIGSHKAHFKKTTGRSIITDTSLRFVSNHGHDELFKLLYSQLNNLEKVDRIVSKNIPKPEPIKDSGKDLKFVDVSGKEYVVNNVDVRDEVFSQIVGFSGTEWQVLW